MIISKNGLAAVIMLLGFIGVHVTNIELIQFITNVGDAIAFILVVWHQLERSDVVGFLFKK